MEDPKIEKEVKPEPKFKLVKVPKAEPAVPIKKSFLWQGICAVLIVALVLSVWTGGFSNIKDALTGGAIVEQSNNEVLEQNTPQVIGSLGTFAEVNNDLCTEDGKPVIMLFSTTWCPHCIWIKDTFDKVASEYVSEGKIAAYHWELDMGDNTITEEVENNVPDKHMQIYQAFNPEGSIPTFVFGCKYYRIGNGYEREDSLTKEEAEFRQIIDTLIA